MCICIYSITYVYSKVNPLATLGMFTGIHVKSSVFTGNVGSAVVVATSGCVPDNILL